MVRGFVVPHPARTTTTTTPVDTVARRRLTTTPSAAGWQSNTRLHESSSSSSLKDTVTYLGKGKDAIVRLGSVLLAPQEEFHHFLRQAAVFIYAMGYDQHDVYVIRGVIIDHPTPFTMKESLPPELQSDSSMAVEALLEKPIYRGGDVGPAETAIMFHSNLALAQAAKNEMIGSSGIYQGGLEYTLANDGKIILPDNDDDVGSSSSSSSTQQPLPQLQYVDANQFKFFFNFMEFTEQELENMLEDPQDDGDAWVSLEIPPEIILNSQWSRGEAWAKLRNTVRSMAERGEIQGMPK
jgi:hypothetical protein